LPNPMHMWIVTLILIPFETDFKLDSQLYFHKLKVANCEYAPKTTYHDSLNKHEIVIDGKKWQLVGTVCG